MFTVEKTILKPCLNKITCIKIYMSRNEKTYKTSSIEVKLTLILTSP